MARNKIRIFDISSHGGIIVTSSSNHIVNGRLSTRIFDVHICPIHGPNVVVTSSGNSFTNSRGDTRLADICACGASLVCSYSPNFFVN